MVRRMPKTSISRRGFLASGAALASATHVSAQTGRSAVAPQGGQPGARETSAPLRIVAFANFEPHEIEKIRSAAAHVELTVVKTRDEFRRGLSQAEVVFGDLTASDLDAAAGVKWVQTGAAGVENLDPKFIESPIVLTNMARVFAPAITETAMGLLICLTRGITTLYMPQFAKRTNCKRSAQSPPNA